MNRRPIGYYVHHQGAGHYDRARAIAAALDRPVTLMGSFGIDDPADLLNLPDDRIAGFDGIDGEATRPLGLHYAPLGVPGIRDRMARIAGWIATRDPVLMIIDVSVEVALLARLMSVPTLVMRLAGHRTDMPHGEAFRAAERLIAPFPRVLDEPGLPPWVVDKTIHAGFLGPEPPPPPSDPVGRAADIVVVFGRGGAGGCARRLTEAALAAPSRHWTVLGPVDGGQVPDNMSLLGWVGDVDAHLSRAALVIGGAGDGTLAAVARHGRRFICLPEERAFGEQRSKAEALRRLNAAVVLDGWPSPDDWRPILAAALALDPGRLAVLYDADAVSRLATSIDAMADDIEARHRESRTGRPATSV